MPAAQTATEDIPFVFSVARGNAITVGDVDAGTDKLSVTLTASAGTLTLATTGGLTFSASEPAWATSSMTFTGRLTQIAAALDGLTLTAPAHFTGALDVHLVVERPGQQRNRRRRSRPPPPWSVVVAPDATNQAPRVLIPAAQAVQQDTPLVLSAASGNPFRSSTTRASAPVTVTLTVTGGVVTLSQTVGPEKLVNSYVTPSQDSARWR